MKMSRSFSPIFLSALFGIASVVFFGCATSQSSLWEVAEATGKNKVFSLMVDGKRCSAVWVSATGHPEQVAVQNAHRMARQILGSDIREIDSRVTHDHHRNICYANVLLATR